jgi:hypothetical protein
MTEHTHNSSSRMTLWHRPSFWIAITTIALLIVAIGTMRMYATASSSSSSSNLQHAPGSTTVLAVITNSGSTNAPASTLTLHSDGSALLHYFQDSCACIQTNPGRFVDKTFPVGTFSLIQLQSTLTQIGNVSAIPNYGCLKSISFGSTTTITYQGKTSGDVSCLSRADASIYLTLKTEVNGIYQQAIKR